MDEFFVALARFDWKDGWQFMATRSSSTDDEIFKLSRIYARGWNAANTMSANDYSQINPAKLTALNPYASEPQRSRWNDGFQAAIRK